ncbi:MAG: putative bifunctional diguanylate cyclase/phosphodiesterase [Spirochaetota bacterium]
MIDSHSLGSFAVAVIAAVSAVWLLWQYTADKGTRWRVWGAAVSADAAVYSAASFAQMNAGTIAAVVATERLQITALLLLVQFSSRFTALYLGRPRGAVRLCLWAAGATLLILTWATPWVVTGESRIVEFAVLGHRYPEGVLGVMGYLTMGYVTAVSALVVGIWVASARRGGGTPKAENTPTLEVLSRRLGALEARSERTSTHLFVAGFAFWALLAFHDSLVELGLIEGLGYLTEYGFLGFSVAVLAMGNLDSSSVRRSLASSEARFRAILHASPHPMLALTPGGDVDYINAALSKLVGCDYASVLSVARTLVPPPVLERIRGRMYDGARRREPLVFETSVQGCHDDAIELEGSGTWMGSSPETVEGFVFVLTDVSDRKEAEAEIRRLAYRDALTELPNRTAFAEQLDTLIEDSARQAQTEHWALLFLDLDNFKDINDRFGHATGDEILKRIASRLQGSIRRTDHCYRLGGDEFLIVVTHISDDLEAAKVAEKLVERIGAPQRVGSEEMRIGASIGITVYPHDGQDRERLLANADIAMYAAKSEERDYRFFTTEMNTSALRRMEIEHALPRAVEQGQLELYFQPIIGPEGELYGAESLARWKHPSYGWISPGEFIPIAENSGTIRELGYWVIDTALSELGQWREHGGLHTRVGINLSPREFEDEKLYERLDRSLSRTGIDPSAVVIELTEGTVMQNPDRVIEQITTLRKTGLRFALDDFGSGYSAFSYLNRVPVDILKIDRAFVVRAASDSADEQTLRTLVSLAMDLGMNVVVEGVETQDQVELLQSMGPVRLQGFYFARPMSGSRFLRWATQHAATGTTPVEER